MCCYFGAIVKGLDAALYAFHTLDCCCLGEREARLAGILSSVTIFLPNHHLRYSTPALSLSPFLWIVLFVLLNSSFWRHCVFVTFCNIADQYILKTNCIIQYKDSFIVPHHQNHNQCENQEAQNLKQD